MARAQGARARMALAFETTYGTLPLTGYTKMPFASTSLGSDQPLLSSELLGYGRDPLAPIKDAVTADGDVVVPIDAEAFGFWLKAAFGDPIITGDGPYTHEFRSGSWTLPSMSIETAMPEVPRYAMYSGCMLDQLSWQVQRSGLLTATARLVAQGETIAAASEAGVLDWEGVGDDAGNIVPVTPSGIDALLEIWPVFEAFQTQYVARGLLLDQEKNVSAPSPTGPSAGARDTAPPVLAPAPTALQG